MGMPDHTLLSLEAGLKGGADIIEDDIRVTRDGILVLAHNDMVRTTEGAEHFISQMSYAELSGLDVITAHSAPGQTIRIITLMQALLVVKQAGKRMNLDLKTDECIEPVSHLVETAGLINDVFLTGCERNRAQLAQRVRPQLRKLLNADVKLFLSMGYADAVQATCEDAQRAGCFGINIAEQLVSADLMKAAADCGLPVYAWTVNDKNRMNKLAELGVRSITTRNVDILAGLQQEWSRG
jgi:glycerophosphoryl diester phosphodiesterase